LFLALACMPAPTRPGLPAGGGASGGGSGGAGGSAGAGGSGGTGGSGGETSDPGPTTPPSPDAGPITHPRPPIGGSGGAGGSPGRDASSAPADGPRSTTTPDGAVASADANYNTPVVCTSGDHWMQGDRGAAAMYPGRACIACHMMRNGPSFAAAGTIFATAHEPDDCNGADGLFTGAAITVIDANGVEHTTGADLAGNFNFPTINGTIPLPIRAKIVVNGRTRAMLTPQTSADCNACHTVAGTKNAPGRIMLP
jgi:hypothetical protein